MLLLLLCASGAALWTRWDAWYVCAEFPAIYNGCFSADGRYLGLVPFEEPPRVLRVDGLGLVSRLGEIQAMDMALSPDGQRAAGWSSSDSGGTHVVWDAQSGKEVAQYDVGPTRSRFTSNGRLLYDTYESQPVDDFFDAVTGEVTWDFGLFVRDVGICEEDQRRLAEDTARRTQQAAKSEWLGEFAALVRRPKDNSGLGIDPCGQVSGNGRFMVTHLDDVPAWQVWDLETGRRVGGASYQPRSERNSVWRFISHDGSRVALCNHEWFSVWDTRSGQKVGGWETKGILLDPGPFQILPANGAYAVLSWTRDDPHGPSGATMWECEIWHVDTARRVALMKGVAWLASDEGSRLVMELDHEGTCIVETKTGAVLQRLSPNVEGCSFVYAFSPDGRLLLANGSDKCGLLWRRRHDDERWGRLYQSEFWLTPLIGLLLLFSLWRDHRGLRRDANPCGTK